MFGVRTQELYADQANARNLSDQLCCCINFARSKVLPVSESRTTMALIAVKTTLCLHGRPHGDRCQFRHPPSAAAFPLA